MTLADFVVAWFDPETRARYIDGSLWIGTFDETLIWLLNFEGEWLMGPELGSFVVDSFVAIAQEFVPNPPGGTDWWFSTP